MPPLSKLLPVLLMSCLAAAPAAASTAPSSPTFVASWGSLGSGPTQFNTPFDATTDALGNIYVADQANHRIQKFDRLGRFQLEWGSFGSANGQFNNPFGVATDASGNVYVVDNNHRVQKFSASGTFLAKWGSFGAGAGQFSSPFDVATDLAGNVYVADTFNHRIQKFTASGAYLAQWGSNGSGNGQFAYPMGVVTDPAGNLYVADHYNHRIQKFTAAGAFLLKWGSFGSLDGQFQNPMGLSVDAVGNLYVADLLNHRIQKFNSSGTFLTKWGSLGSGTGQFDGPTGVIANVAGNLYVVDQANHRIQQFSGAGATLSEPPPAFLLKWGSSGSGSGEFTYPSGVATDAAGNVYVSDFHRVQKFSSTGFYLGQWGSFGGGNGQFVYPGAIAVDAAGNVFVVDNGNYRVQKFSSTGVYLTQWGSYGAGNGQFNASGGLAFDAAGNVYVADGYNHRIQKFSNTGAYLTQWGSYGTGDGQFSIPSGVAIDVAGNVFVADYGNARIQRFSTSGAYLSQWGAGCNPAAIAIDARGDLIVVDRDYDLVHMFTPDGIRLNSWGSFGAGDGQFDLPIAVTADAAGNIYAVAFYQDRVQKFEAPPAIALISDVRNDQGRQVRLRILSSSADSPGSGVPILRYDIFRRVDLLPGTNSTSAAYPTMPGPTDLARRNGAQLAGWDQVGSISAYGESEYSVVVPTLVDATAASLEYSAFMVRAATADPYTYFDSGVDNGFSVDNLPPVAPSPFTANYGSGATHLHWGVSTAPDFFTYRLYRGSSADFVPGLADLIAASADTGYADAGPAGSFYKLSAVDRNGNEGPYALVGPLQTVEVPAALPLRFALEGVRPNPASGDRLVVHFALPSDQPATLSLVDLAGRRVAERSVGSLGPGRHSVDLAMGRRLPAGLYVMRLEQGTQVRISRCTILN